MRTRSRSIFLTVLLSLLFVSCIQSQQEITDKEALLKEISGNYEFYFDEHYQTAKIHVSAENELIVSRLWDNSKTAKPVDLNNLRFSVFANNATFGLVFKRDKSGDIYRCVLESPMGNLIAQRIDKVEVLRMFSKEDYLEDLQQMRTAMEKTHPALYDFTDKATFEQLFEQAHTEISDGMPIEGFMKLAAKLVARIGCGHSSLVPSTAYMQQQPEKFFPLVLRFIAGKAYLLKEIDAQSIMPVGSEIVSINGIPMPEIVENVLPYVSADALLRTTRMYKLTGFFPTLYTIHYDFPESYRFVYRPHGEDEVKECTKAPVPLAVVMTAGAAERRKMFDLNFDVPEDSNYAVMKINSFAFYDNDNREKFFGFIDTSFKRLKDEKIPNLILDVRGNFGGDPYCTTYLLAHLASEPIQYYPEDYKAYEKLTKPMPLAENRFDGKLFTLIDSGSFSSTGHFAAILKYHKIGTLVGSETAGTYTCNAHTHTIELKHTRCKVTLARRIAEVIVKGMPRDRGVLPDHEIVAPIDDVITGNDSVLEYAVELIGRQ